jgi:hypothetical protein
MEFYGIGRETCPSVIRHIGETDVWVLSFLTLALDEDESFT